MKTTQQKLKEIEKELREIYNNDNDGPRLIAELVREFPNPRGPKSSISQTPMAHSLG